MLLPSISCHLSNEETIDYCCRQMDTQMDTNNDRERNKHTKEYKGDATANGTDWHTGNGRESEFYV